MSPHSWRLLPKQEKDAKRQTHMPMVAPGKKRPGRGLPGQILAPGLLRPGYHAGRSPPQSFHGPKRASPHLSSPGSWGQGKGRPSLLGAHLPRPRPRHASGPRRPHRQPQLPPATGSAAQRDGKFGRARRHPAEERHSAPWRQEEGSKPRGWISPGPSDLR